MIGAFVLNRSKYWAIERKENPGRNLLIVTRAIPKKKTKWNKYAKGGVR